MDCPLLSSSRLKPCSSTRDVFAHTLFSSDKYCRGIWFTLCPRFRQQQFKENVLADLWGQSEKQASETPAIHYPQPENVCPSAAGDTLSHDIRFKDRLDPAILLSSFWRGIICNRPR